MDKVTVTNRKTGAVEKMDKDRADRLRSGKFGSRFTFKEAKKPAELDNDDETEDDNNLAGEGTNDLSDEETGSGTRKKSAKKNAKRS